MIIEELKPGDVLMLKSDKDLVREYLSDNFGNNVADLMTKLTGQEYLHSEMYLGEGWVITATPTAVHVHKYNTNMLVKNFDIFRPKFDVDEKTLINEVEDQHNKRYDWFSLYWNIASTITGMFGLELKAPFDTKFAVICSELIVRIFEKMGVTFQERAEFMTPQDIVDSGKFYKI